MNRGFISEFVSGLIDFYPDYQLSFKAENDNRSSVKLAAAALKLNGGDDFKKVGIFIENNKKLMARVFNNKKSDSLIFHFLFEPGIDLKYAVLSKPDDPKYFLIDEDNKVTIPSKFELLDECIYNLTLPIDVFSVDISQLDVQNSNIVKGFKNSTLEIDIRNNAGEMSFQIHQNNNSDRKPDKLMYITKDTRSLERVIRITIFRNDQAVISLPEFAENDSIISVY